MFVCFRWDRTEKKSLRPPPWEYIYTYTRDVTVQPDIAVNGAATAAQENKRANGCFGSMAQTVGVGEHQRSHGHQGKNVCWVSTASSERYGHRTLDSKQNEKGKYALPASIFSSTQVARGSSAHTQKHGKMRRLHARAQRSRHRRSVAHTAQHTFHRTKRLPNENRSCAISCVIAPCCSTTHTHKYAPVVLIFNLTVRKLCQNNYVPDGPSLTLDMHAR